MDSIILFSSTPKMFVRFAAKSAWGPKTRGFLAIKGPYPDGLGVVR